MIIAIGEILFDVFPEYRRPGGAPFNFIYHLKKLGMEARFFSRVGGDEEGREIGELLKSSGFRLSDLQVDENHSTGKVIVKLDGKGVPEFNILPDVAYDYIEYDDNLKQALGEASLIYFGTLVQRSDHGFNSIQKILQSGNSGVKYLYDINLRPGCYNRGIITESLKICDVLKINDEELGVLKDYFNFDDSESAFVDFLMKDYSLDMVALTRGGRGSDLFIPGGRFSAVPSEINGVEDTVGAGDAYTSILAAGYIGHWNPEKIIETASNFAADMCRVKGAIPEDDKFYEKYRKIIG